VAQEFAVGSLVRLDREKVGVGVEEECRVQREKAPLGAGGQLVRSDRVEPSQVGARQARQSGEPSVCQATAAMQAEISEPSHHAGQGVEAGLAQRRRVAQAEVGQAGRAEVLRVVAAVGAIRRNWPNAAARGGVKR
jgi:hypothetical protein